MEGHEKTLKGNYRLSKIGGIAGLQDLAGINAAALKSGRHLRLITVT